MIFTAPKTLAVLDYLNSHRSVNKMDGEITRCSIVQQSILQACGLNTLLRGKTSTTISVTLQVIAKE